MTFTSIGQTARMQAEGSLNADGGRHGGTVSGTKRQSSSEIGAWLGKQAPEDMDKAAVSRASQHGVALRVKYQSRFPSGPNGERLPSYEVAVGCGIHGDAESRAAAMADLQNFLAPASIRQIERWLAELSVISASRGREDVEASLMLTAYASRLSQYPADVVRHALMDKTWKFWPTWDELHRVCEAKTGPRRHMMAALSMPVEDPEPERRPATQDEKDRIAALIAERFPNVPQTWRDRAADEATKGDCFKVEAAE